jgi:DNA polymerase I
LSLLRGHGALLALSDGQLEIVAGAEALPAALLDQAATRSAELLAALEAEAAAEVVVDGRDITCQHPHVVISNGMLECRRCDMRRRLRPADEADAPPPEGGHDSPGVLEAETAAAQLVADGLDIIAALARRGISLRIDEDGRPLVRPMELVDEADKALLAAHRDAVLAALGAQGSEPQAHGDHDELDGATDAATRNPGSDRPRNASTEHGAVHIDVPAGDPQLLDELAVVLTRHPGPDEVLLHFEVDGHEVVMQAGERFRVTAGPPLQADLETWLQRVEATEAPRSAATSVEGDAGADDVSAAARVVPATELRLEADGPAEADRPHVVAGAQAVDAHRVMVATPSEWERALPEILAEPVLGLDTEATGLDPFTSRLRLVQLAARGRVYLVDAFRLDPRALQPVLDDAQRLVGHNLKFDLRTLMAAGLRLPADIGHRLSDTMLAGQLLGAGVAGERYRLGDLTQRYLGVALDKTEQVSDWSGELTDDQLAYAARDAAVLLPLRDRLRAELERAELGQAALIESRALPSMAWLEQSGAPFDQAAWLSLAEIAEEQRRRLERDLDALAPSEFGLLPLAGLEEASTRWSSPKQVLRLLESRGVALPDTRDETLHEHRDDDPLIPLLLEHRDAAKRSGAFGREFLCFVQPVTGRIHADYFQLGSEAGRASCRRPNLQQIPHAAEYRACFRAPEGRVLVGADYGQIEPRCAAEISGEERLLAAYRDRRDVYREVASGLGVERSVAKTIVLGALYGLGAQGLVRRLKADAGIAMAEDQARSYLDAFFAGYPALDRWRRGRRGDGAVATRTLSGRRRLNVEDYTRKINTPIQGSAADVFKLAMGLLCESRDIVPTARLVLSVHDELVVEVDEADADTARRWLADCMRRAGEQYLRRVPVVVEVGTGPTWADTKKKAAPVEEVDEWAA